MTNSTRFQVEKINQHIVEWLLDYAINAKVKGFVVEFRAELTVHWFLPYVHKLVYQHYAWKCPFIKQKVT